MSIIRRPLSTYGLVAMLLGAVFFIGCYQPIKVPIDSIRYSGEVKGPRLLFVFLPGNGDSMTVFERWGLVEAARAHGLHADMIAVNAHLGYYLNGTILTRLKQDVIDPARAQGYAQIWLIGNSLGGFGSLSYVLEHPEDITGAVLLGPFPGEKDLINEIRKAGGLSQWDPGEIRIDSKDTWERHVWFQLKQTDLSEQQCRKMQGCAPKIYMGYGKSDRFTYGQEYLASLLPQNRVLAIDGGHSWFTWRELWGRFLDQQIFTL
jgi:pimeloyl-ACP methyl ester carboxylesterase